MTELVLVSAADEASLVAEANRLVGFLDRVPDVSLADVACTCALRRGECTLAVIAPDTASLRARLVSAVHRLSCGSVRRIRDKSGTYYFRDRLLGEGRGRLAFVYPGVMSFYPDMLRDLAIAYPECRAAFDELEEALVGDAEFTPSSFIFPPAPYYRHDADIYKSGAYAQALVSTYAGCMALTSLLASFGLSPDGVVGFAGGDLAAMMRSGAAGAKPSRPDRMRVISDIYRIVHKAVNHGGLPEVAMVTVLTRHPEEVESVVSGFPPGKVTLVVDFSPRYKTYAVERDFADEALAAFAAAGVRAMRLALDRPFNTPMCESLVPAIRKFAAGWMRNAPDIDVYSCATADRLPSRLRAAREDIAGRWARPVRFVDTIRRMYADGYRVFLEVGPRGLLTAAVGDTLRDEEHAAIALDSIHRRGLLQTQHAIGQLVALGAQMDISETFRRRGARELDFDAALSLEVRKDSEMRLSRSFPRLTLLSDGSTMLPGTSFIEEPRGRGAKAAARAAAIAQQARRQRQFDFGAMNPLVSDADVMNSNPGVSVEMTKLFRLSELPFLGDYALGTSQLSYSDPNLKGLILLTLSVGAEIMAEVAEFVVPNLHLLRIEDLNCRRMAPFVKGEIRLFVRAERVAAHDPSEHAVKVQIRDDSPNSAYTLPVMEATCALSDVPPPPKPAVIPPLARPRSVHWSGRDVYPSRICFGRRLRGIQFVEAWSESGINYEVSVPPLAGNVSFTRFPMWVVNPLLLEIVTSGFMLWRSHERLVGAFSLPFRLRRLSFGGPMPGEGARLRCYLRLSGVTPKSQICDISVTDGNGNELMAVSGLEEQIERMPAEYRQMILQPAMTFLTAPLGQEVLGEPATDVSSAFITDVPYVVFERNENLWLKALSHVALDAAERKEFAEMTGSASRLTEWLFGRIAAKEAVRRFLTTYYQARWSDADVRIWADGSGKPHALGAWSDFLSTKLDIAIAHTAKFVVAVAAANARVGVDVESIDRDLSEEFASGVFLPEELELAAQAANASQAVIKFWCAKEALSKALGTGIRYSPREMTVTDYLSDAGVLTLRLSGAWSDAFKNFRGRDIHVTVKTVRNHALASCFIPSSLFDE
ncbi:MAG: 4'-phosphopantetheinyl transferase superfamily protein [Kiritimatiellae bacterium]|nr:4'-phosphopantetheinyl transferase superfamily protein [Kiritimatiellia bacterium]